MTLVPDASISVPAVLDAVPAAVVVLDAGGRIRGWNSAAEVLYGHARAEVVGAPVLEVLFDATDREAAKALLGAAGEDRAWEGDFRVRRCDGVLLVSSFRLVPVDGGVTSVWIATDGIDHRLAEEERSVLVSAERAARATAEEALGLTEAILSAAPVAIAVVDLQLRYVRVNDAYAALSGTPAEDHPGTQLGDLLALPADIAADVRRVVTTGRTILDRPVELDPSARAADRRHFTASYFPVRSAAGALMGAGLTLVEITQVKRAEAERSALLRRAELAQQRLAILATASTVLATTMEIDELLVRLTRVLSPSAADWCVIELFGPAGAVDHVAVSHRDREAAEGLAGFLRSTVLDPNGDGPVSEVVRSGQARLVPPAVIDQELQRAAAGRGHFQWVSRFSVRSSAIVPIESRGQVIGVLILSTDGDRVLDDDDLDLAVEVAQRAALAVSNARAFQQEHQIAESLQRALLPATVPSVPGLDLAVRYLAATDGASVGGDWYDVLDFGDGTTGVLVGDVVGHDIAASTSMGQLRSALRVFACEEHESPAAVLARVDRLSDRLGLDYASCIFGIVEPCSSSLRWSNAGHPPPLLLRRGQAEFLDESTGVLLGVTDGADVQEVTTPLVEGDILVLYTDGLIERRGEPLQAGLDRLAAVAAGAQARDAASLCDALLEALVPASTTRDDDVALLVAQLRRDAPPPGLHRLAFEPAAESVALTRGFTAGVLGGAGHREHVHTAVLLASELVTNAVRHARGPCALVVDVSDGAVEVSVEDGDPRPPVPRTAGGLAEDGRGLLLVSALADDWGVRPLPEGKATWFTLRS